MDMCDWDIVLGIATGNARIVYSMKRSDYKSKVDRVSNLEHGKISKIWMDIKKGINLLFTYQSLE